MKADIEESVKKRVRDILEKHTYKNNTDLIELSYAADNIIATILEEDQVIEKVYDIKQRSADLYEHSICICSLAILTSLKLKLPITTIHNIGVACLLHDIGLRYQTFDFNNLDINSLSEFDLAEYKKHPIYGYTVLKEERWLSTASKNIVLFHHEFLDGTGFPLKTKEVPFEAQIVTVCDVFDEMICGIGCQRIKVYEAIEYLKTFRDIKFDNRIVNVLLSFTAVYPAGTHVLTSEGETAIVISQNKDFQDRPIIRIIKDKNGDDVFDERIINLVKVFNVFIEKALD